MKKLILICTVLVMVLGVFISFAVIEKTTKTADAFTRDYIYQDTLTIALLPEMNILEQRRRYEGITGYLSEKMGVNVRIKILHDYGEICQAFIDGDVDAGFFGSFSYGLTHAKVQVEPIARPVWLNGSSTYRGSLVVRKDSGIKTVNDMKGKRLALVHRLTTAGYLFPLNYFHDNNIDDIYEYFSNVAFCGSHDEAAWAVYSKEADVGFVKNHIVTHLNAKNSDFANNITVLAESAQVPSNGLAVRKDIDPVLKQKLKENLLKMHNDTEGIKVLRKFGAQTFIETTDDDYRPLYEMIDHLKMDLASYGYEK